MKTNPTFDSKNKQNKKIMKNENKAKIGEVTEINKETEEKRGNYKMNKKQKIINRQNKN